MIALEVKELKTFTSRLFSETMFDAFLLYEASFQTMGSIVVDGHRNLDFYEKEEQEELSSKEYLLWKEAKPLCYQILRGKRLPLRFKIVLMSPKQDENTTLLLNIRYDQGKMMCMTGASYQEFTMDRSLEKTWDEKICRFFDKNGVSFDQV